MAVLLKGKPFFRFTSTFKAEIQRITGLLNTAKSMTATVFAKTEWNYIKRKRALSRIHTVDQLLLVVDKAGVVASQKPDDFEVLLSLVYQYRNKFSNAQLTWAGEAELQSAVEPLEQEVIEPNNTSKGIFASLNQKHALGKFIQWILRQEDAADEQEKLLRNGAYLIKVITTHPALYRTYRSVIPNFTNAPSKTITMGRQYFDTKIELDGKIQAQKGWFTWFTSTATRYYLTSLFLQNGLLDQNLCALIAQTDDFWALASTKPGVLFGRRELSLEEIEILKEKSPFFRARLEGKTLLQLALDDDPSTISYMNGFLDAQVRAGKQILVYELLANASIEEMEGLLNRYQVLRNTSLQFLPEPIFDKWIKANDNISFLASVFAEKTLLPREEKESSQAASSMVVDQSAPKLLLRDASSYQEDLQQIIATQKNWIQQQTKTIGELNERLKDQAQAIANIVALKSSNAGLQAEVIALREQMSKLEQELSDVSRERDNLLAQNYAGLDQAPALDIKVLEGKLQRAEAEATESRKKLLAAEANASLFKGKNTELQNKNSELEARAKEIAIEKQSLIDDENASTKQLAQLKKDFSELKAKFTQADTERQRLEEEFAQITLVKEQLSKRLADANQAKIAQADVSPVGIPVAKYEELQQNLETAQAEKCGLDLRIKEQLAHIESLQTQIKRQESEQTTITSSMAELKTSLRQFSVIKEQQQAELSKVNTELADIKTSNSRLNEQIRQANREKMAIESTKATAERQVQELKQQLQELSLANTAKPATDKRATASLKEQPTSELAKLQALEVQLKTKLNGANRELEALRAQQGQKEQQLQRYNEEMITKARQIAEVQARLQLIEADYEKVKGENEELKTKVIALTPSVKPQLAGSTASLAKRGELPLQSPDLSAVIESSYNKMRRSLPSAATAVIQHDTTSSDDTVWSQPASNDSMAASLQNLSASSESDDASKLKPVARQVEPELTWEQQKAALAARRAQNDALGLSQALLDRRRRSINPDTTRLINRDALNNALVQEGITVAAEEAAKQQALAATHSASAANSSLTPPAVPKHSPIPPVGTISPRKLSSEPKAATSEAGPPKTGKPSLTRSISSFFSSKATDDKKDKKDKKKDKKDKGSRVLPPTPAGQSAAQNRM